MSTAVEDPDLCCLCGQRPAAAFLVCLYCLPKAIWFVDLPWNTND